MYSHVLTLAGVRDSGWGRSFAKCLRQIVDKRLKRRSRRKSLVCLCCSSEEIWERSFFNNESCGITSRFGAWGLVRKAETRNEPPNYELFFERVSMRFTSVFVVFSKILLSTNCFSSRDVRLTDSKRSKHFVAIHLALAFLM